VERAPVPHLVVVEEVARPGHGAAEERVGTHHAFEGGAHVGVGGWVGWNQARHPVLLALGEPDPEIGGEGRRDLVREEAPGRSAGGATHDLAEDPAIGAEVVPVPAPGFPRAAPPRGCGVRIRARGAVMACGRTLTRGGWYEARTTRVSPVVALHRREG